MSVNRFRDKVAKQPCEAAQNFEDTAYEYRMLSMPMNMKKTKQGC